MKVSLLLASTGLAVVGAVALLGAAAPARAEGSTTSPLAVVEGLVTQATAVTAAGPGTLVIHPVFGGDVTLSVSPSTHFRKAGGSQLDTPDEVADGALLPAVQKPSPAWFVGLFARVAYTKADNVAVDVALSRPEPLLISGVVGSPSPTTTDLVLTVPNRGDLHLTLNTETACRRNGLPASDASGFQPGDLAEVLFWHTATEDEAIRVNGRLAPPQHFEGMLSKLTTDPAGAAFGFDVTHGGTSMSFTVDGNTSFKVDGKPGAFADLKTGDSVSVYYRKAGGSNLALGVIAFSPRPTPLPTPKPNDSGTGDKGKRDSNPNGSTGTGDHHNTTPPAPKPVVTKPVVVEGVVSAALGDGSVFKVKVGATEVSFTVDVKTQFRINDKAATSADLAVGQHVHVVFVPQADGSKLALYVLIHPLAGPSQEHGSGGGAGK